MSQRDEFLEHGVKALIRACDEWESFLTAIPDDTLLPAACVKHIHAAATSRARGVEYCCQAAEEKVDETP